VFLSFVFLRSFFHEHLFLFRRYGNPDQYEQFKRVQELAAKVWAVAIIEFAACYRKSLTS
jgi:hypothetical protein